jgi:hypothetical protein
MMAMETDINWEQIWAEDYEQYRQTMRAIAMTGCTGARERRTSPTHAALMISSMADKF